jgi:hypothetical protein
MKSLKVYFVSYYKSTFFYKGEYNGKKVEVTFYPDDAYRSEFDAVETVYEEDFSSVEETKDKITIIIEC